MGEGGPGLRASCSPGIAAASTRTWRGAAQATRAGTRSLAPANARPVPMALLLRMENAMLKSSFGP